MPEKKHQQEVVRQYSDGKLSAGRAAEMLGITLREWYELLERKGVAIKWDEKVICSVRS